MIVKQNFAQTDFYTNDDDEEIVEGGGERKKNQLRSVDVSLWRLHLALLAMVTQQRARSLSNSGLSYVSLK